MEKILIKVNAGRGGAGSKPLYYTIVYAVFFKPLIKNIYFDYSLFVGSFFNKLNP